MTNILALTLLAFSGVAVLSAQEREPEELSVLREKRDPRVQQLNDAYRTELVELRDRLTKQGKINEAVAVQKELALLGEVATKDATPGPGFRAPAKPGLLDAKVEIPSATYSDRGKSADVTKKVKDYVEEKKISYSSNPQHLVANPSPGWNKGLIIVYTRTGKGRRPQRGEGERVRPESFYAPQDEEEFQEWLVGTRWKSGDLIVEFAEAKGFRKTDPRNRLDRDLYPWSVGKVGHLNLTWTVGGEPVEAVMDGKWASFKEQGEKGRTFEIVAQP